MMSCAVLPSTEFDEAVFPIPLMDSPARPMNFIIPFGTLFTVLTGSVTMLLAAATGALGRCELVRFCTDRFARRLSVSRWH